MKNIKPIEEMICVSTSLLNFSTVFFNILNDASFLTSRFLFSLLWPSDLTVDDLIKIDASTSDQPCTSFGVNKNIGQGFVDMYNEGEVIFVASELCSLMCRKCLQLYHMSDV